MHSNLTCSLKHWWAKPVFSSGGCSSIRAAACLLVVQLGRAACTTAPWQNTGTSFQGLQLWTESCLQHLQPLLSLGAWHTRHFSGNATCTGIVVAVLLWEGEVTLWGFGPSVPTFLNVFKQSPWFLSAPVPHLFSGDCELQRSLKALQKKMLHES